MKERFVGWPPDCSACSPGMFMYPPVAGCSAARPAANWRDPPTIGLCDPAILVDSSGTLPAEARQDCRRPPISSSARPSVLPTDLGVIAGRSAGRWGADPGGVMVLLPTSTPEAKPDQGDAAMTAEHSGAPSPWRCLGPGADLHCRPPWLVLV